MARHPAALSAAAALLALVLVPGPAPAQVQAVKLSVDKQHSVGKCPLELHFAPTVTVAKGPVKVTYQITRSDGASSGPLQAELRLPGPQLLPAYTWKIAGAQGVKFAGWAQLEITQPAKVQSGRESFLVECW